jgi:ribonuclease HII
VHSAGIDENGLGPLLGPMVVTGVATAIPHDECECLKRPFGGFPGLRDSKKIFSQKKLTKGEALALSIVRMLTGRLPSSMMELLHMLSPEGAPSFPCSEGKARGFCLDVDMPLPLWASPAEVDETVETLGRLLGFGGLVYSVLWCPLMLNDRSRAGVNKFAVDLRSLLDLVRIFRDRLEGSLDIVAGKVGSRVFYEEEMERMGVRPVVLARSREESRYRLPGDQLLLRFVVDADDKFVHVSMASIVGKYVREVFMEAIFRFAACRCGEEIRRPSGYRDRVSKEFIRKFGPVLAREGISPGCFVRER